MRLAPRPEGASVEGADPETEGAAADMGIPHIGGQGGPRIRTRCDRDH